MCKRGETERVWVKIDAGLSHTGKERWAWKSIDSCIVGIVSALQSMGIDMLGSCCGHLRCEGYIALKDGRMLIVLDEAHSEIYQSEKREGVSLKEQRGTICGAG